MPYIYCDACGIGFHDNVLSCPECGRRARRTYDADPHTQRHTRRSHARPVSLREDAESEVWESIYSWRSGTVEGAVPTAPATQPLP
jgi:hypothetical protein